MDQLVSIGGLGPRTPVLAGVGQTSERIGQPGYRRRSAVDLTADAARAAFADTGAVRQFEISSPAARARPGQSDNYPRSVATTGTRMDELFPPRPAVGSSCG